MEILRKKNNCTLLLILLLFLFPASCGDGNSVLEPVSIPSPVASLISVSVPDEAGLVTVTGQAGSVPASAEVTVQNLSASTSRLFRWLLPTAWAQTVSTVTADADGAWETTLEAALGDTIRVTFEGQTGDPTDLSSPTTTSFSLSTSTLSFDHSVGITACPQTVDTFTVTNTSNGTATFTITSDTNAIDVQTTGVASDSISENLAGGASLTITVIFDCSTASSFAATLRVTGVLLDADGVAVDDSSGSDEVAVTANISS